MSGRDRFFKMSDQKIRISNFQSESVAKVSERATGFDLSFLSHWPYLAGPHRVEVPSDMIQYFNSNPHLFCVDNLPLNEAWSYYSLLGGFEYIFSSNEELNYRHKNTRVDFNSEITQRWPQFVSQLKSLPFEITAATVIALQPQSRVCVHIDKKNYGLDKLLIPLNTPTDSHFLFYQYGAVPLQVGQVYAIDASHMHYAVNRSQEVRYNLVIRGLIEDNLPNYLNWIKQGYEQNGIPAFYKVPDRIDYAPANLVDELIF